MENRRMQIITELMDELQGMMEYGEEDFSSRLGRQKPDLEVVKVEGEMPMDEDEDMEMPMEDEMEDSPESKLKSRLLKLRGA